MQQGTYLRFFLDGAVRENTLIDKSTYPQDSGEIMKILSKNGFRKADIVPNWAESGWGCCQRGSGQYSANSFQLDKFEPAQGGANPAEEWEITDQDGPGFTAVLRGSGDSGEKYTFQFHSVTD
jgi:hypothetical protein